MLTAGEPTAGRRNRHDNPWLRALQHVNTVEDELRPRSHDRLERCHVIVTIATKELIN